MALVSRITSTQLLIGNPLSLEVDIAKAIEMAFRCASYDHAKISSDCTRTRPISSARSTKRRQVRHLHMQVLA